VNTSQQVGGSIGTALLNTIAASATTGWIAAHATTAGASAADAAQAAAHGYVTAFWWGPRDHAPGRAPGRRPGPGWQPHARPGRRRREHRGVHPPRRDPLSLWVPGTRLTPAHLLLLRRWRPE
jgi:hypothetical protein